MTMKTDREGNTPLHLAAKAVDVARVRELLEEAPEMQQVPNRNGDLPIDTAAHAYWTRLMIWQHQHPEPEVILGNHNVMDLMDAMYVDNPAAPRAPKNLKYLAVSAARLGHANLMRKILHVKPDAVSTTCCNTWSNDTLAHYAAAGPCLETLQVVLDAAPQLLLARNNRGFLPVHAAAAGRWHHAVQYLLRRGPTTLAETTGDGWTLLHLAAMSGNLGATTVVMHRAPDLALTLSNVGVTPLSLAASRGHVRIMNVILAFKPTCVEVPQQLGRTPLHAAADALKPDAVEALLRHAPSLADVPDDNDMLPLHRTLCSNVGDEPSRRRVVKALIEASPLSVQRVLPYGYVALHFAADRGSAGTVQLVLDAWPGAVNVRTGMGNVPLYFAASRRHLTAARALIQVPDQDPAALLDIVMQDRIWSLVPTVVTAHQPLSEEAWERVPQPCPGLGASIPAVMERGGRDGMRKLLQRLAPRDMAKYTCVISCLHFKAPALPDELRRHLLILSFSG